MKTYFLYLLTGIITFWTTLVLFGVSVGFASYVPMVAIVGSCMLFSLASPMLLLKKRVGLIIGAISLLMILPFDIGFTISIFNDDIISWGTLLGFIPIVLMLLSLVYTIKGFNKVDAIGISQPLKILLVCIPISLSVLYIAFYGKYWNWQMFAISGI